MILTIDCRVIVVVVGSCLVVVLVVNCLVLVVVVVVGSGPVVDVVVVVGSCPVVVESTASLLFFLRLNTGEQTSPIFSSLPLELD